MDEMFRMLGAEHQAELARHAAKWQRAKRLLNDGEHPTSAVGPTRTAKTKRVFLSALAPRPRT